MSDAMAFSAGAADSPAQPRPESDLPQRRDLVQQAIHDTLNRRRARLGIVWVSVLVFFACFASVIANSHPIIMKSQGVWSSPMLRHFSPADVVLPVCFIAAAILIALRRLSFGMSLLMIFWIAALVALFAIVPGVLATFREAGAGSIWSGIGKSWMVGKITFLLELTLLGGVVAFVVFATVELVPRRAAIVAGVCVAPLLVLLIIFPINPPRNVVYEKYRQLQAEGKVEFILWSPFPFSPTDRLRDRPDERLKPPSAAHWAGTDDNGADLLSRMIHGSRIALAIGFIATGIAVVIGISIGGLVGYFSGVADLIFMRLIEMIEAIPSLVLLIALTAAYGRNLYMMMAIIGMLSWTGYARFIRAEFLKLRKLDFVQAAVASGLRTRAIIFRHMLPNGLTPVLVSASFGVASAILLESTLSFLGLGLVDEPSWGSLLNQARSGGTGFNWWIAIFPGALIFLTVFTYNLIGEALRDALDPKLRLQ